MKNISLSHIQNNHYLSVADQVAVLAVVATAGFPAWMSPFLRNVAEQDRQTLAEAEEIYQSGDLQEAIQLVESVAPESQVYPEAQTAIAEWSDEWQRAERGLKMVEIAISRQHWQDALRQARRMPDISYWQQQAQPLVQQAQLQVDAKAQQLLQAAYDRAIEKDFDGAIANLQQISCDSTVYPTVVAKIREYREKSWIRANYLLQQAYDEAGTRNFAHALAYLHQIQPGTPVYTVAQRKIAEYSENNVIRADYLLQQAYEQAIAQNFTEALTYLQQISPNTPAYETAQQKISEYAQRLGIAVDDDSTIYETAEIPVLETTDELPPLPTQIPIKKPDLNARHNTAVNDTVFT